MRLGGKVLWVCALGFGIGRAEAKTPLAVLVYNYARVPAAKLARQRRSPPEVIARLESSLRGWNVRTLKPTVDILSHANRQTLADVCF